MAEISMTTEEHSDAAGVEDGCLIHPACAVMHTYTGREEELIRFVRIYVDADLFSDVFVPKRVILKRQRGEWRKRTEALFPGYVFIVTADTDALFLALKRVPRMSRLLESDPYQFYTLEAEEEEFVRRIGAERGDHTFELSTVRIGRDIPYHEGDPVRVVSGDLAGFEGSIVGFDLHRRKAMVKTTLFGGTVIHVGIELLDQVE